MAMTVTCLDGQQYSRQLGFGQINDGSGNGGGHLGKRKRPGSRSGLTTSQVKINGFWNQRSMSVMKGEEIASVRKISLTKPDVSSLLPMTTTTADSTTAAAAAASATTIHINPFRSTDNPPSPKSRRRRLASAKTTTHTRDTVASTLVAMTIPSPEGYGVEHGHEVEHTDPGLATSLTMKNATSPSTRVIRLCTEPLSQISAAALPEASSILPPPSSKPPLSPSSSSTTITVTSTESLKPCHICQSRPRQKSDLHKYVDCTRCTRRVCYVCARECAGLECRARLVCSGCCVEDHGRRNVEVASGGGGSEKEWTGDVYCWDCFGDG